MKDLVEIKKYILATEDQDLVLCTLVRKSGSSYRGIGSKKVIGPKTSLGLLSGGCLEASIEKSARERKSEMPFIESFSTLADEDRLLGYQTGCQGVIDILFERIPEKTSGQWQEQLDLMIPMGPQRPASGVLVTLEGDKRGKRVFTLTKPRAPTKDVLFEEWIEPLHLVVIGCGPDAPAYLPLAHSLGWTIQFIDYRRSFVDAMKLEGIEAQCVALDKMADVIPQGDRVAVLMMTHNYEADLEIMRSLRNQRVGYFGCLGPAKRYERLKKDLLDLHGEFLSEHLQSVISAPMGIFTHNNSPEEIALSTVAQIQDKLVETLKHNTWTLVLAAGASRRFGSAKALAAWDGGTLLSRALQTAEETSGHSTLVVTGGYHDQVLTELKADTVFSFNDSWEDGMGSSIAEGVAAILRHDSAAKFIVVLPVDQPFADSIHLKTLITEAQKTGRCVLTEGNGFMGPPAVIPQKYFAKAMNLRGDQGLKKVLSSSEVVAVQNFTAAQDFDSPEELAQAQEGASS